MGQSDESCEETRRNSSVSRLRKREAADFLQFSRRCNHFPVPTCRRGSGSDLGASCVFVVEKRNLDPDPDPVRDRRQNKENSEASPLTGRVLL